MRRSEGGRRGERGGWTDKRILEEETRRKEMVRKSTRRQGRTDADDDHDDDDADANRYDDGAAHGASHLPTIATYYRRKGDGWKGTRQDRQGVGMDE